MDILLVLLVGLLLIGFLSLYIVFRFDKVMNMKLFQKKMNSKKKFKQ